MELIRGLHNLKPMHRNCVATIGNFDGVHMGHQAVLQQLVECSRKFSLPTTLITFEPQPLEYFRPKDVPARLTRLREKLSILQKQAIDRVLCLRFDKKLASLTATEFVERILVNGLNVKSLIVGDDFMFGKDRQGDFAFLKLAAKQYGFEVKDTESHTFGTERISSTRIRVALEQGDLAAASKMLGRDYEMHGRVAHGDKRGRTIGFPTANIYTHRRLSPVRGVFAVTAVGSGLNVNSSEVNGVANVGTRPTVEGTRTLLEVHLFDFNRDIYGQYISVHFRQKLREEKRFDSFDALKTQIALDVAQARAYFGG